VLQGVADVDVEAVCAAVDLGDTDIHQLDEGPVESGVLTGLPDGLGNADLREAECPALIVDRHAGDEVLVALGCTGITVQPAKSSVSRARRDRIHNDPNGTLLPERADLSRYPTNDSDRRFRGVVFGIGDSLVEMRRQ
jgi:hypothetical protein